MDAVSGANFALDIGLMWHTVYTNTARDATEACAADVVSGADATRGAHEALDRDYGAVAELRAKTPCDVKKKPFTRSAPR